MSAFPAGSDAMSVGAPCRYGAQARPLREKLAGAGAAALAHGLLLGTALAIGAAPHAAQQKPASSIVALTTAPAESPHAPAPAPAQGKPMPQAPAMPPPPAAKERSGAAVPVAPASSTAPAFAADPGAAPAPASPLPTSPTPARAAPPPPPAQADGAPARAAYLHRLWLRIMEHRPAGLGLAGTVTLGFRLDGEGRLAGARVTRSSGIALLDRAALQALRRAAPFPAPAPGMESGGEDFEVEIRFG